VEQAEEEEVIPDEEPLDDEQDQMEAEEEPAEAKDGGGEERNDDDADLERDDEEEGDQDVQVVEVVSGVGGADEDEAGTETFQTKPSRRRSTEKAATASKTTERTKSRSFGKKSAK